MMLRVMMMSRGKDQLCQRCMMIFDRGSMRSVRIIICVIQIHRTRWTRHHVHVDHRFVSLNIHMNRNRKTRDARRENEKRERRESVDQSDLIIEPFH